jgi:uncharacterized protein YbjT (DUF2867 family)
MEGEKGTVVVAGATGRAGRCIVEASLKRGYQVRALLVKPFDPPQPPGLQKEGVELHYGDLTSVESLSKVMEGAQFVISAIGSKKPFSKKENDKIDNMGNQNLAKAAKAQSLQHVVVISSTGAGNSKDAVPFIYRLLMGPILTAKGKSEECIRTLGINYTIIRPGGYAGEELSGKTVFGEGGHFSGRVTREQIAQVCVDALTNPSMKNRTFEVVDESTVKEEKRSFIVTIE